MAKQYYWGLCPTPGCKWNKTVANLVEQIGCPHCGIHVLTRCSHCNRPITDKGLYCQHCLKPLRPLLAFHAGRRKSAKGEPQVKQDRPSKRGD